MSNKITEIIENSVRELNDTTNLVVDCKQECRLPSLMKVIDCVSILKAIVFPGYFGMQIENIGSQSYHYGVNLERLYKLLEEQIGRAAKLYDETAMLDSQDVTLRFIESISGIRKMLMTDVEAVFNNDPAAKSKRDVIFCYPSINALIHYRIAHKLLELGVPLLPRIISERAHSETGIDIHPGAVIGEYFSIDHGTGVVIGETCIIGRNVNIYQGVTLGAKSFTYDDDGHPLNTPRHPIIEDGVTIYSNTSVLGRITIGCNSIIGGNIWLTHDIAPNSKIVQHAADFNQYI